MMSVTAINPDRGICGIITTLDTPDRNGEVWQSEQLDLFLGLEPEVPLWLNHMPPYGRFGFVDRLGAVRRYAAIDYPVSGVLALGEVESARGIGDGVLHDLRLSLSQQYFGSPWGFSVGAVKDPETGEVIIREVSLTHNPACRDAKVLAVGPEAVELFDMLTEKRPVGR